MSRRRRRRRRSSSKRPAGLNKQADALKLARVAPARLPSLLWPGLAAAGKLARGSGRSSRASLFPANKLRLAGRRSASSARAPLPIRVLDFQQQPATATSTEAQPSPPENCQPQPVKAIAFGRPKTNTTRFWASESRMLQPKARLS